MVIKMKQDEIDFLINGSTNIHHKRLKYILKKWELKGWYKENKQTIELDRIKNLIINKDKLLRELDLHVVIIINKSLPPLIGILDNCGDNGYHLHTKKTIKGNWTWYIDPDHVAYIEQHPNPQKIWQRLNYLYWKYHKIEDCFHKKITTTSYGSITNYTKFDGIFKITVSNPKWEIGSCYPNCQCKKL